MVGAIGIIILGLIVIIGMASIGRAYNYFKDKTEKKNSNGEEIIIHKPEDELFKLKKLSEKGLIKKENIKENEKKILDKHFK